VRVLIINSMFVNALYRRCADELGRLPGVELTVLTTESWVMNGKLMPLDPVAPDAPYRFVAAPAAWKGKENRGFYKRGLSKVLRDAKPEVIYLMEEPFSVFATQIIALKKIVCPSVPVIFFTWNNLSLTKYDYRPSFAYRNFARLNLRSLDQGLTANSDGIAVLREFGYEKSVRTVGYGVDTGHYSSARDEKVERIRTELGIRSTDKVIGYVGRMLHMKGVDLLIEAYSRVCSTNPNLKLLLVGSGEADAEIDQQINAAGIVDRVVRVPVIPHSAVPDYMHTLDVLVLPSRRVGMWAEQFGRVLVEAMAARKIVIGSSSGAIPEVVGEAGFIFRENDALHLAQTLDQALSLSSAELSALRERAAYRSMETYSWKRFAEASLQAMHQALEGRSA
jgi:L-malate glycosyltransferase